MRPVETLHGRLPLQDAELSQHAVELKDSTAELSAVFPKDPLTHCLSIIVNAGELVALCVGRGFITPPHSQLHTLSCVFLGLNLRTSHPHKFRVDKSAELLKTWSTPIITLPDVPQLAAHITMPLSNHDYDRLLSKTWQTCSNDDFQKLFRRNDHEQAENLLPALIPVVFRDAPEENGTEASYVTLWDDNIRCILRAIFTQGQTRAIRGSNRDMSTLLRRPDFGLLTDGSCIFRGEEKVGSYSGLSPRYELTEKLVWTYDPVHDTSLVRAVT